MSTFKKYLNIISESGFEDDGSNIRNIRNNILKKLDKDNNELRDKLLNNLKKDNNELRDKLLNNLKKGSDTETKSFIDDKIIDYDKFMREELPSTIEEFKFESKNLTKKAILYLDKAIEIAIENLISNKFTKDEDKKAKKESKTSDLFKELSEKIIRFLYSEFNSKIRESNDFYTHYRVSLKYIEALVSEIIFDISDSQILKYYNRKNINYSILKKYIIKYLNDIESRYSVLSKLITERFIKNTDSELIESIGSQAFVDFLLDNDKENLKKIKLNIISEKNFGSVVEFKIEVNTNSINYQNAYGRKIPKVSIGGHNRIEYLKKSPEERAAIEKRERDRKISKEDSLRAYVSSAKGQLAKENPGYYGTNKKYHDWKNEVARRQKELNKYLKKK